MVHQGAKQQTWDTMQTNRKWLITKELLFYIATWSQTAILSKNYLQHVVNVAIVCWQATLSVQKSKLVWGYGLGMFTQVVWGSTTEKSFTPILVPVCKLVLPHCGGVDAWLTPMKTRILVGCIGTTKYTSCSDIGNEPKTTWDGRGRALCKTLL
eukprot:TRINITY_DN66302_c6_g1_i1.p1 TRINITY_DN66302_c6_g1~~TRINITY_DN66302_c6_g1_i1.p1  ORF type:complete len:154 (+),score=3.81 TRINITY_DN66302_c6_g1_i1:217-678(+)